MSASVHLILLVDALYEYSTLYDLEPYISTQEAFLGPKKIHQELVHFLLDEAVKCICMQSCRAIQSKSAARKDLLPSSTFLITLSLC
jgi:hypothetical protein